MELPVHRGNNNLFLGLTSVVGLIGGAYLLQCGAKHLLSKLVTKKPKKSIPSEEQSSCNVCCAELDLSSAKNYVTCCTCGKQVCRGIKCANWLPKAAQWVCELCHSSKQSLEQTSSWVAEQMSFNQQKFVYPLRARSEIYIPISSELADSSMQFESVSQVGMNSTMNADERSRIREYVEEIVAEMLGGNLDHIKVGQLSKSENYLPAIVNGHNNNNKSSNSNSNNNNNDQLADISQTRLRTLIESIIAETLRSGSNSLMTPTGAVSEISLDTRSNGQLSGFHNNNNNNNKRRHRTEHYFEPKIYQDLLATAVLNKIADKEGNTRLISESTPDLSARNIDENYNAEALSTTSDSSIEPRSDCSLTDHELGLNTGKSEKIAGLQLDLERESVLSDYIAAHMVPLPDFSASVTESEDDIMSMTSSMVGDGTWEDNWLFKKKRSTLQSSATPSSIGMLVPAPKENIRAQIGDRTADEVSDLSEIGSDAEETSLDLLRCDTELNDRLLSKHLIGGQNTKLVLDELVDRTSLTSNTLPAENEPAFTETTNPLVQQPTKTSKLLVPPPPTSFQDDEEEETEDPGQKLIAGSIAEREVKKWYNAVEMPNNPYAPEALKQRISGTQERFMDVPNISPSTEKKALALMTNAASSTEQEPAKEDYKRYSRDYYINNAPLATTPTRGTSLACSSSSNRSTEPTDEDIVINEVIPTHGNHGISSSAQSSNLADLSHWTLSKPVRRSSSLKFINKPTCPTPPFLTLGNGYERPSTSASHYRDSGLGNEPDDDFDVRSQHSWHRQHLPKRHTQSTLSLHSNGSGRSFGSSVSKRHSAGGPSAAVLTQFEKQLLHKDLKRNSFRAVSATSKDFVMNPLFESDQHTKPASLDDQDSGVDSCLNGFSNNSLLF
ncbi:PREDICTED: general transcriptional corepressor trfA isoform X9 [Drosophila arizonae]|uniref:General transcriptional corepressor trfA isoform X9 n=1 Tax=Drosophila arizonae TaxID=7263 RepID=A0ABM1PHN8_DROAR|nr:PREDICTED: general transcriptional corepressor trfA isoform X9 [Drosophila arizonae]